MERIPDSAILKSLSTPRAGLKALVGFDGFVDSLYRVIRDHRGGTKNPFVDIQEFGKDLQGRAGRGGGFELSRLSVRAGGNAPLMASGLTALGVGTTCVGALGEPGLDAAFTPLKDAGCELLSTAPAALTMALEFEDGKFMFNDSRSFEAMDWRAVTAAVGLDRLSALAGPADLVALVDWANLPHSSDIWRGLLEDVLLPGAASGPKKVFVDLADISRADPPQLQDLAALLRCYREVGTVALGLNENEAVKLADRLGLRVTEGDLDGLGRALHGSLGLDLVVIHPRERSCVVDASGALSVPGRLVSKPLLSTGGGDHYNAGFCLGWLLGLPPAAAARLGGLVSSLYVEQGVSPGLAAVRGALEPAGKEAGRGA